MDEFIGVAFQFLFPIILRLACATIDTFAVFPAMPDILEADIAVNIVKFAYGVGGGRVFGAIQRAPRYE